MKRKFIMMIAFASSVAVAAVQEEPSKSKPTGRKKQTYEQHEDVFLKAITAAQCPGLKGDERLKSAGKCRRKGTVTKGKL